MRGKVATAGAHSACTLAALGLTVSLALAQGQSPGQNERQNQNQNQYQRDRQQPDTRRDQRERQGQDLQDQQLRRAGQMTGEIVFVPLSDMDGKDIHNSNGEKLGEVEDLLTAKGSGAIRFVVVETGAVLGMGGRHILVPYDAFSWDHANDRLVLEATKERLERLPDFNAMEWGMARKGGGGRLGEFLRGETDRERQDPYQDRIADARTITTKGTVRAIERRDSVRGAEEIVLVLDTPDQGQQRLLLGPSWYVTTQTVAPMRGQQVSAVAWQAGDELVAQRMTINNREIALRNDRGQASWSRREGDRGPQPGYILAADLHGADIVCQDQNCGELEELIVECTSGKIAFLSIDPDENFLGMADKKRLAPWSLATVIDEDTIRVDATRDMILKSIEAPSDWTDFGRSQEYRAVYSAFQTEPQDFRQRPYRGSGIRDRDDAFRGREDMHPDGRRLDPNVGDVGGVGGQDWMAKQEFRQAVQSGDEVTLRGRVVNVSTAVVGPGLAEGEAVVIEDRDGKRNLVLLGSGQKLQQHHMRLGTGDEVTIRARKFEYGGRSHVIATAVKPQDGEEITLWNADRQEQNQQWNQQQPQRRR